MLCEVSAWKSGSEEMGVQKVGEGDECLGPVFRSVGIAQFDGDETGSI